MTVCATHTERLEMLKKMAGDKHPRLQKILLDIGGDAIVLNFEEDEAKLLSRGKTFDTKDAKLRKGRACQCHGNAGYLWDRYKSYKICTGWALSTDSDGLRCWRQHSWCLNSAGKIVETTANRDVYFGFILDSKESEQFYFDNTL